MGSPYIRVPDKVVAVIGGDLHAHSWEYGNDPTVGRWGSRIERSLDSLREAKVAAQFYNVPILINGDLMHTKNSIVPEVQLALTEEFECDPEIEYHLGTGNHERPDRHSNLSTLEMFHRLDNVTVHKDVGVINLTDEFQIVMLPYFFNRAIAVDKAAREAIRLRNHHKVKHIVLCAHYPLKGAVVGTGFPLNDAPDYDEFYAKHYDLLLFSDIHRQQPVGTKGYHLGATHAQTFNEAGYTCHWWLLGILKNNPCIWPVPTNIKGFVTAASQAQVETLESEGNFVRVKIEEAIRQNIANTDTPRIATTATNISVLIDGYLDSVKEKLELDALQVQCVKDRITWAMQQKVGT